MQSTYLSKPNHKALAVESTAWGFEGIRGDKDGL